MIALLHRLLCRLCREGSRPVMIGGTLYHLPGAPRLPVDRILSR